MITTPSGMPRADTALKVGAVTRSDERFVGGEVTPLAGRQVAENDLADSHALQTEHAQPDGFAHAADLALLALLQDEA